MTLEQIQLALAALNSLGTFAVWLYVRIQAKQRVTLERIRQLEANLDERLDDHAQRLAGLEQARSGGVRHADLEKIWEAMRGQQSMLHEIKGRQEAANRLLEELIKQRMNHHG